MEQLLLTKEGAPLHLIARLTKVDEAKREVSGLATAEVVDKEGEIFDYATSKPLFEAWSGEISKATDGKSLGNVREMHQPSAVGKLTEISFDDKLKAIGVTAKIVDDAAWAKCLQGVYTGFSIGGKYVKVWKDGDKRRYTAEPAEVSVVDNPCNPDSHFTAVKADGSTEVRKFASVMKDMYSVSSLASLLQSAVYLQMDSAYEAEYEGDNSKIPDQLKTWVKDGAAILARMTEEELSELLAFMKSASAKLGKVGAQHSTATKEHHDAISKCMDKCTKALAAAQPHMDALMGNPPSDKAAEIEIGKQVPAEVVPTIETQESNMQLEKADQDKLNKAADDSASSLSKIAEVEKGIGELKAAQAEATKGQEAIAGALTNITKVLEKLSGVGEPAGKVVPIRTVPPTVTVTKESDGGAPGEFTELSAEDVEKLSPAKREEYTKAMMKFNMSQAKVTREQPGFYNSAR